MITYCVTNYSVTEEAIRKWESVHNPQGENRLETQKTQMWKEQLSHLNKARGIVNLYTHSLILSRRKSQGNVNTCCLSILSFKT